MNDRQLFLFSIISILVFAAWIIIPYVRRQQDLCSARNFLLVGAILYVGFSGINSSGSKHYYTYGTGVYHRYYAGIIVFFTFFYLANMRSKWPVRWAARQFKSWPPLESFGIILPLVFMLVIMAAQVAVRHVPGLDKLTSRAAFSVPVFALTFALFAWYKNKLNPIAVTGVIVTLVIGIYLAFALGGGRRPLYSMLITIPVCLYWWKFRYLSPKVVLSLCCIAALGIPIVDGAYRAVRHVGVIGKNKLDAKEGAETRWKMFRDILTGGSGDSSETLKDATLHIGWNAAENSLVTIYMVTEGAGNFPEFRVHPFHTLYVISTLWVPRSMWEDKPWHLGVTLPFDSKVLKKGVQTNWGPGIVAHGYYEGGLLVLVVYGWIAGGLIRYFDELLRNNPTNPYLTGFLAAGSVQIMGWIRGDLSTMVPLTFLCFGVFVFLMWMTRAALGSENPLRQPAFAGYAGGGQTP